MTSDAVLRVVYVINGLGTGGAERSLAELLGPLRQRDVDIRVVCLEHRAEGVEDEVVAGNDVSFVGPGLVRSWRAIRREIAAAKPHVVHTTIFESDVLGRLASIGTGVPVVSSIVNTSYDVPRGPHPDVPPAKLRVVRAIDGFTARHLVTRFHALTRASAAAGARALGVSPDLIEVIPRGRDVSRLGEPSPARRARIRSQLDLSGDRYVMLSVGRQEHQKGQVHAIEALATIVARHPDTVLLVAGRDGAATGRLRDRVRSQGVGGSVRWLGHRDDVPDLMAASDVLLFPSLYEGFGGTVIEAMALGLPVVASDIPTLSEVTSDAAIMTEVGSSSELAGAVIELRDDPTLGARLSAAGRARFSSLYTIDAVADQMADFYRAVVAARSI